MTAEEARKTLDKHGYVFGRSNTSQIRDPAVRAEIKAACLVLKRTGASAAALAAARPAIREE